MAAAFDFVRRREWFDLARSRKSTLQVENGTAYPKRRTAHGPGTPRESKPASSMTRVGRRSLRTARSVMLPPHLDAARIWPFAENSKTY
ncbi:hypothetical protein ACCO45_009934 [Purpureocillium lilacinum]|uniref:Uncharacterized protein n=1 Tax=Purpureocillium lilacinum TaxID=33203 RepID=A0ACC4DG13_PURLI